MSNNNVHGDLVIRISAFQSKNNKISTKIRKFRKKWVLSDSIFTLGLGTLGVWATKNVSFGLSKFVAPIVRDFFASLDPNLSWYLIKTPLPKTKGIKIKK
jgi:hypothetical protein